MGPHSDHGTGTSYAPVARRQQFGSRLALWLQHDLGDYHQGALIFMVFQGEFTAPVFVDFMKRLLKQTKGKIVLIVAGHPTRKSNQARNFFRERETPAAEPVAGLLPGAQPR